MNKLLPYFTAALLSSPVAIGAETSKPEADQPVVQLAILLDNSGSMSGLIGQAKSQLWTIVNEFIAAKQDGKAPKVQVALFEYGVNDLGAKVGHIRQLSGLTDDLDKLSEQLFAISPRTSGSEEYCGWVIKDAVSKLNWDKSSKTYKAIFIAGNEPFTQGSVPYQSACKSAIEQGIIVNTIHCGSEGEGIGGKWKDGAALADGKFLVIDHNQAVAAITAPQDKEIAELNAKLNDTYISYGSRGAEGKMRQVAQDVNAAKAPAAATAMNSRAMTKASANYNNAGWDLVDRAKEKDFDFAKVKEDELPAELKKLSPDERKAYVEKKREEREGLQKQIAKLAKDRESYVADQTKTNAKDSTLGKAVTGAVREQAEKKGMTFEKK